MKPQLTAYLSFINPLNTGLGAIKSTHPMGDGATRPLAHLVGRPALSLLLAGMGLPRRRFAPAIPPRRTIDHVHLRFQGSFALKRAAAQGAR
ncbi:MAG: hypothetical protein J0L98_03480 [Zoogloea sp.]|nr:hypothetical protein [Zoogloea sp.]